MGSLVAVFESRITTASLSALLCSVRWHQGELKFSKAIILLLCLVLHDMSLIWFTFHCFDSESLLVIHSTSISSTQSSKILNQSFFVR